MTDLMSFNKEQRLNPSNHDLPTVIAANEALSIEDAYAKAVEIHSIGTSMDPAHARS